jgi:hypothetical protein
MIDADFLDKFKNDFLMLLAERAGNELDKDELYLNKNRSIVQRLERSFVNLDLTVKLYFQAKNNNDELAMQAAILRITSFMADIYGLFIRTTDDIDRFIKIPAKIPFPEDYKIPDHYNYPIK